MLKKGEERAMGRASTCDRGVEGALNNNKEGELVRELHDYPGGQSFVGVEEGEFSG